MDETKYIWMDGNLVLWRDAKVHVLTHTLHYGLGVFEGIRFYETESGPAVFRLKEHIERLLSGAKKVNMKVPFSEKELIDAVKLTVKENDVNSGYIRPIIYFGYGKMGLNPDGAPVCVSIACWPWGKYLGEDAVKVKTSSFIRIHPKSTHADAKITGHYVNSILANIEASYSGFDEALLLDFKGNVAEGPGENIFCVKAGKIYTPRLGNILPGITRASIIQIAKDLGYVVTEKDITIDELKNADEAFFTGTAAEVTAIRQIDDKLIGNGSSGLITKKLKGVFMDAVCLKSKKYKEWLALVNE